MNENVTVDEAIKKGHRMATWPGIAIMMAMVGINIALVKYDAQWSWIIVPVAVCALALSWLVWSVQVPKWKLWAFEHVRNVHELKKRAIQDKLIWPDDSIFNKTEIWSAAGREQWQLLQLKFQRKDEFIIEDDPAVPVETVIYYSKGSNFVEMVFMLLVAGTGIWMMISGMYFFGGAMTAFCLYTAFKEYRQATNKQPQIIINEKGIETIHTPFNEWKHIVDEDVEREGNGKHTSHYLVYKHSNGREWLKINDYGTTPKELKKLLKVYHSRYVKKKEWNG